MQHRPFPEIVTGESDWEVFEETERPRTDMTNKKMYVPLDDNCHKCGLQHGRMVRRHELGHVKWSPKSMGRLKQGVMEEAVHLLEEIRINHLLTWHGIPMSEPHKCINEVQMFTRQLVEKGSVSEILKWCIAAAFLREKKSSWLSHRLYLATRKGNVGNYNSPLSHELEATLIAMQDMIDSHTLTAQRIKDLEFVIEQTYWFHRVMIVTNKNTSTITKNISFNRVKKYAKDLSDILSMFSERPTEEEVFLSAEQKAKLEEVKLADEEDEDSNLDTDELYEEAGINDTNSLKALDQRNKADVRKKLYDMKQAGTPPNWGTLKVHNPQCSINLSNKLRQGYTRIAKDYGTNPNKIQRYVVDKKIFSRKHNVYGGTVLIDASGSMHFSGEDILEVMQQVPAVTIAMYNGMGSSGDLRIIARNGRRVNEEYLNTYSGRANIVDLPALEWLGKQEPKRIWVSDLQVSSKGSDFTREGLEECVKALSKYHITRLADINEVKQFVKQLNVLK